MVMICPDTNHFSLVYLLLESKENGNITTDTSYRMPTSLGYVKYMTIYYLSFSKQSFEICNHGPIL